MEPTKRKNSAELESNGCLRAATELLQLLARQIRAGMADNDNAMIALVNAHAQIVIRLEKEPELRESLTEQLNEMVIAFQEHDALNQRLEHVIDALHHTGNLINDPNGVFDAKRWQELENRILDLYTMAREHAVHKGPQYKHPPTAANNDDIELF